MGWQQRKGPARVLVPRETALSSLLAATLKWGVRVGLE